MLLLHIIIAFASMGIATYAFMRPSQNILHVAYASAVLTFATGTYLLIANPAHLVPACIMGFGYLSVVGVLIAAARRKLLAFETNPVRHHRES